MRPTLKRLSAFTLFSVLVLALVFLLGCSGGSGSNQVNNDIDADNDNLIEIASLEQLDWVRNNLAGFELQANDGTIYNQGCATTCNGYELVADLDFDTNGDGVMDTNDEYFDYDGDGSNSGWLPIGDFGSPFEAIFEGNGHTISNLFIERGASDFETGGEYIGLFGSMRHTAIRNLNFDGDLMEVTGDKFVGGVAGRIVTSGTISNVTSSGAVFSVGGDYTGGLFGETIESAISDSSVSGEIAGYAATGGLVGRSTSTTISDSYVSGTVTGNGDYTGGLIGMHQGYLTPSISRSYASGTVTGTDYTGGLIGISESAGVINYSYFTGSVTGANYTGGLVGSVNYDGGFVSPLPVSLQFVFATGTVTTNVDNYVGGIVGIGFNIQLGRCFATNSVTNNGLYVGGIVGDANTGAEITRCFAANDVEGTDHVGAIIGWSGSDFYQNNWFANDLGLSDGIGTNALSPGMNNVGMSSDTLSALQSATAPDENGVFLTWDDNVWDFGTANELPGLIYDDGIYRDGDADGQLD